MTDATLVTVLRLSAALGFAALVLVGVAWLGTQRPTATAVAPLACATCRAGHLTATRVPRRSPTARVIGYVLLVASVIACVLLTRSVVLVGIHDAIDAVGTLVGYAIVLPALALGSLLARSRSVWRCDRCGAITDRAQGAPDV